MTVMAYYLVFSNFTDVPIYKAIVHLSRYETFAVGNTRDADMQ